MFSSLLMFVCSFMNFCPLFISKKESALVMNQEAMVLSAVYDDSPALSTVSSWGLCKQMIYTRSSHTLPLPGQRVIKWAVRTEMRDYEGGLLKETWTAELKPFLGIYLIVQWKISGWSSGFNTWTNVLEEESPTSSSVCEKKLCKL